VERQQDVIERSNHDAVLLFARPLVAEDKGPPRRYVAYAGRAFIAGSWRVVALRPKGGVDAVLRGRGSR
jgi:hypothetical protein